MKNTQQEIDDGPFPFMLKAMAYAFFGIAAIMILGCIVDSATPTPRRASKTLHGFKGYAHRSRPYLTPQVEEWLARDSCEVTKQRCRDDGVCDTCLACVYQNRRILGWAGTKCKSPKDCVLLETNVDWERENVNPGWCEAL